MDTLNFDPYSTSCVEPKERKAEFKVQKQNKPTIFYSQAGKFRLKRISDDNNLDEEILFMGACEQKDYFVREQVSDYIQHYLLRRARRYSLDKPCSKVLPRKQSYKEFHKKKKPFQDYDEYIRGKNSEIDQERIKKESDRITRLLISGEIKFAPEGFSSVLESPIYKLSRLRDSLRCLEKTEILVLKTPLHLDTSPLIVEDPWRRDAKKCLENNDGTLSGSLESLPDTPKPPTRIGKIDDHDESMSSGFGELTLSSTPREDSRNHKPTPRQSSSSLWKSASKAVAIERERNRSFSLISEWTEDQLSNAAEEEFSSESITGDLEISKDYSWNSEQVELLSQQINGNQMYELASKIVGMYLRQEVAADEHYEDFGWKK